MTHALRKDDVRRNPLAVWIAEAVQFTRDRKALMLGILVAILVGVAGFSVYTWNQVREEREAQRVLAKAQTALLGATPGGPKNPDEAKKLYVETIDKYPRTIAAEESLIRLGNLQFDGGKYDEAIAAFQRYLTTFSRGRFVVIAGIGKAYAEEAKGDLPAAEKTLSNVLEIAKDDPLIGEAYTSLAQTYEAMKKRDDALRIYGQISERFTQTHWAQNALQRMSILKAQ
jgi:predicted negative regulator of RcsB-dependent stress response